MICNECETVAHCTKHGCVPKQPAPVQEPEIVERIKCRAGQTLRTVRNPNITARESIELANWIVANTTPPAQEFVCSTGLCHYKPAAPDLQAELDATNRQVEILSDALAESRLEVAALKAVQEPVAWANPSDLKNFDMKVRTNGGPLHTVALCLCTPPAQPAPVQEPVFELQKSGWEIICDLDWIQTLPFGTKLYTTPPSAQRQWVGLTDDEWDEFSDKYGMIIFGGLKQEIEAKLKEKNNG